MFCNVVDDENRDIYKKKNGITIKVFCFGLTFEYGSLKS